MNLKGQTVSGAKWQVGSSFLQKIISFGSTIILARILGPAEFGLFALAFVAIDALGLFKSMGFDTALIRRKDDIEKAANTAFFIIPILGIFIYIILVISAPLIGRFLNNSEVISVVRMLGVIFIITCFGKVPAALLEKNMQFKLVSIAETISVVIYSATAIFFAILGFGVWSLVVSFILRTLFYNIFVWVIAKWRPRFAFDLKIAKEMFNFGKFIFLGAMVFFLRMNLDNLLVGKLLGVKALGLYAIAFNIANFSADYFGGRVNRVIYPAYSKLQNDLYDLRSAALKVFKYVSLFVLPIGVGIYFLGDEFLRFFYGSKWLDAASVLKILALAGIFNTLPTGMNAVFLACGKPKWSFWITTLQVTIFLVFITPAARMLGLNGVGIVVSLSSIVAFLITLFLMMKILSINFNQIYVKVKPVLLATLAMALGIIIVKAFLIGYYKSDILFKYNFIALMPFALLIYVFSILIIEKRFFSELKGLF